MKERLKTTRFKQTKRLPEVMIASIVDGNKMEGANVLIQTLQISPSPTPRPCMHIYFYTPIVHCIEV